MEIKARQKVCPCIIETKAATTEAKSEKPQSGQFQGLAYCCKNSLKAAKPAKNGSLLQRQHCINLTANASIGHGFMFGAKK